MDFSKLNFQIGKDFSSKVHKLFGLPINSAGKPAGNGFLLLVSFSRKRSRLSDDSVVICLQSVLEGIAKDFAVFQLEEQIFRIAVSFKQVGFLTLNLNDVAREFFKLHFFLCNDLGGHGWGGCGRRRGRPGGSGGGGVEHGRCGRDPGAAVGWIGGQRADLGATGWSRGGAAGGAGKASVAQVEEEDVAWKFMISCTNTSLMMSFALPVDCPEKAEVKCDSLMEIVGSFPIQNDTYMGAPKILSDEFFSEEAKRSYPPVETEARRSPRIRNHNDGFKHNSCASKNCLACAATPPALTNKIIKKVGEDFCKIKPEAMTQDALSSKSKTKQAVGDKKAPKMVISSKKDKGNEKKDDDAVDQESNKKIKK
uniref:Uncharacterized protein n=1 Tax=Setaria viridis TaxID=4556 RepID=A0A4U6UKG5_SETVI|nr:hypothetical protein SEVIR_5G247400v2 [Setaria viridis]